MKRRETECNTCRYYDPMEGYCHVREVFCRGHDGDGCPEWVNYTKKEMKVHGGLVVADHSGVRRGDDRGFLCGEHDDE